MNISWLTRAGKQSAYTCVSLIRMGNAAAIRMYGKHEMRKVLSLFVVVFVNRTIRMIDERITTIQLAVTSCDLWHKWFFAFVLLFIRILRRQLRIKFNVNSYRLCVHGMPPDDLMYVCDVPVAFTHLHLALLWLARTLKLAAVSFFFHGKSFPRDIHNPFCKRAFDSSSTIRRANGAQMIRHCLNLSRFFQIDYLNIMSK